MSNMAFELFKTKKGMVNREQFYDYLKETLEQYPFASLQQITIAMKSDARYTEGLVLDYITKFIKENPGLNGAQVSQKLLVSLEFIEKLVSQGVLVPVSPADLEKLQQVQNKAKELNDRIINKQPERNDMLLARQLGDTVKKEIPNDLPNNEHKASFHTSSLKQRTLSPLKKF